MLENRFKKTCKCGYTVSSEGEIPKKVICTKCKNVLKENLKGRKKRNGQSKVVANKKVG